MSLNKIRKNDRVQILVGRDKGKIGSVKKVDYPYYFVEGLNLVSKCIRANPRANQQGGIIKKEAPIHVSNLAIVDANDQRIKVGVKVLESGKKVRVNKKTQEELS